MSTTVQKECPKCEEVVYCRRFLMEEMAGGVDIELLNRHFGQHIFGEGMYLYVHFLEHSEDQSEGW